MPNPEIIGYVCIFCQKAYKQPLCSECNEYKSLIPITENILRMFDKPTLS